MSGAKKVGATLNTDLLLLLVIFVASSVNAEGSLIGEIADKENIHPNICFLLFLFSPNPSIGISGDDSPRLL
jgi:hypothetical protein